MSKFKLISLIITGITLSACGGGGGSGTATTPDGTKIDFSASPKGTVGAETTYGKIIGQNNDSSFYGAWRDDGKTEKELRYQGTKATDIPRSGVATYKGDAVWISGYDGSFQKGGVTTLKVDFGQKTVEGSIKFSVLRGDEFRRDITLHKGHLSNADFSGKASVLGNGSGRYEGALFGPGAKEAAGKVHFSDNSDIDVAFGGVRR